jgi:glutathione S-transferase
MITLYTFGPYFGLPDASPFVTKAEMLLKLAGLEYRTARGGVLHAPKGKLPYIDDDGAIVADSTLIRVHLEQKRGIDFDRGLSARERGIAWAVEKMLEDNLYWLMIYWRWVVDANFERGPKGFFKRAPALVRPFIIRAVRKRVRRNLWGHGIGRHNEAEMTVMADRLIESLAQIFGDNAYLMGAQPCGADATAFAFIAGAMTTHFDAPIVKSFNAHANLVAYRDRMMRQYYPQLAK